MAEEYIEGGYVKLSRRIFNSKTFNGLNAIQKYITIYLILMANWKDNEWWENYQKKFITIKRGSFITSVEQIRKEINSRSVTTKKIRLLLKKLQAMQFLEINQQSTSNQPASKQASKRASHYSLITIIKYDLYQSDENYKANKRARQGQGKGKARATTNKDNKDKNDKNVKKEYIDKVFLTKIEYEKLVDKFGENLAKDKIEELSLYIKSQGKENKYKDHYATILAWDRKKNKATTPAKAMTEEEIYKMIGGKDE